MTAIDWLQAYIGSTVVCDLADGFLVIGTLAAVGPQHVGFTDADLHDHKSANSPRDVYVIESRKFGVRVNRARVDVPRQLVIAVSKLEDVIL